MLTTLCPRLARADELTAELGAGAESRVRRTEGWWKRSPGPNREESVAGRARREIQLLLCVMLPKRFGARFFWILTQKHGKDGKVGWGFSE